jgi:hypothetical protein
MRVGEALSRLVGQPVHFDELAAADAALASHAASTTAAAAAATDRSASTTTAATKQRRRKPKAQQQKQQQQQQQQSHLLDDIDPDAVLDLSAPASGPEDSSAEQSVEQSEEGSAGEWESDTSEAELEKDNSSTSGSKGLLQPYAVPDEGLPEGYDDDRVEGNARDGKVPLYLHQAIESKSHYA